MSGSFASLLGFLAFLVVALAFFDGQLGLLAVGLANCSLLWLGVEISIRELRRVNIAKGGSQIMNYRRREDRWVR